MAQLCYLNNNKPKTKDVTKNIRTNKSAKTFLGTHFSRAPAVQLYRGPLLENYGLARDASQANQITQFDRK